MLLLRAVVERDTPELADLTIVRGARVAAFASPVTREPEKAEDALRAHDATVRRIHERGACLPARFGRTFADTAAVAAALDERGDELEARLREVRGRVELGVDLVRTATPGEVVRSSGRGYMESLLAQETGRRDAAALVARLVDELDLDRPYVRHGTCHTPAVAASLAILVERDEVTETAMRIKAFAKRALLVAEVYGPMPPYSFVS